MKTGIELITEERKEQIKKHGYDLEHDQEHEAGELATAAVLCATPEVLYEKQDQFVNITSFIIPNLPRWNLPLNWQGNKMIDNRLSSKTKRIHQLKVAGALIAAEIDRLLTLKEK